MAETQQTPAPDGLAQILAQLEQMRETIARQQAVIDGLKPATPPAPVVPPPEAPTEPMVEITNNSLTPLRIPLTGGAAPKFLDIGPAQSTEEDDAPPRGLLPRKRWEEMKVLHYMTKPGKGNTPPMLSIRHIDPPK